MAYRRLLLVLGLIAVALPARAATAFSTTQVTISSTSNGQPQELPATLYRPEGPGPFPAIVIMHDCSGRGPKSSGAPKRWAERLAPEGYVLLLPDSFTSRGFPAGICTVENAAAGADLRSVQYAPRAVDAYAALDYLRTLPEVDGAHIGVMGGSHGGSSTLATMVDSANPLLSQARHGPGFAAGIALYPGCGGRFGGWNVEREFRDHGRVTRYIGTYKPIAPLLILIGEKDDWTPAEHCQALATAAQQAGYPVTIKVYPGAYHSFDSAFPPRYVAERRNANQDNGRGATTGGDPVAWADSVEQVKAFFARYLKGEKAKD